MGISKQLYQLQEVENELESAEKSVRDISHQVEAAEALTAASTKLAAERRILEEIKKRQRALEGDAGDIDARLKKVEQELYSGRVRNQKELAALQREADTLKTESDKLESRQLELMDRADESDKKVSFAEKEFKTVETEWEMKKPQLAAEFERAKTVLAAATQKRRQIASGVDPSILKTYQDVKKSRSRAVVAVDRGMCTGCRIALSVAELQKVRSGQLVRCGSCGRILYSG